MQECVHSAWAPRSSFLLPGG